MLTSSVNKLKTDIKKRLVEYIKTIGTKVEHVKLSITKKRRL
jgi:hypothetical protein